jgi:hypothetical protein
MSDLSPVLPSLQLPFTLDPALLQEDLARVRPEEWVPHFNVSLYEGDWSGIALRSLGGAPAKLYPDPTGTGSFADTEVLARCPYFKRVLDTFACPLTSVRLLKLRAGSSIREHSDYKLGYEDGEVRLHIPIVTDADVAFFVDGRRVAMEAGECWYINVNLPHRVDNSSRIDRVHLVVDCVVDDWLAAFFPATAERGRMVPGGGVG